MGWQGYDIFTFKDLLIAPIFLLLIYLHASIYSKKYDGLSCQRFFFPALHIRMLGCFLSVMMYQYYYHGGDMFGYYAAITTIREEIFRNPSIALDFLTATPSTIPQEALYACWTSMGSYIFRAYNSLLLCQIGTVIGVFTLNSCLATGLILAYFSFLGCWKLYEVFKDIYPHLEKPLAYSSLFVPSVIFWGSAGLMKDTIALAAVGYFTWAAFHFFIKREMLLKSMIYISISYFLLFNIKAYIAMAFIPALLVWILLSYENKIESNGIRLILKPFLLIFSVLLASLLFSSISESSGKYASGNIVEYAAVVQQDHTRLGGSTYNLGITDPSIIGMITTIPQAIIVTLFRPYLWEAGNPLMIFSAVEGLLTLLLTIYLILILGPFKFIGAIFSDANVIFLLTFSLLFAFAVGFSAYNFGALARYKIPALPFYFALLVVLLDKAGKFKN